MTKRKIKTELLQVRLHKDVKKALELMAEGTYTGTMTEVIERFVRDKIESGEVKIQAVEMVENEKQ
jgi:hypothetical protein